MNVVKWELYYEISRAKQLWEVRKQFKLPFELHKLPGGNSTCKVCWQKFLDVNFKTFSAQLSNIISSKMWPSTFNKKSATISGWQALGDFASVKQQLQKIRASTRVSSSKKSQGDQGGPMYSQGGARPLPPLPARCRGRTSWRRRHRRRGKRGRQPRPSRPSCWCSSWPGLRTMSSPSWRVSLGPSRVRYF